MATMQTGCITGGVKKSSGVEVDDDVASAWAEVRDDSKSETDWIICGFDSNANSRSNNRISLLCKGSGGIESCVSFLDKEASMSGILFGGSKLLSSGRFVSFMYMDLDHTPIMLRGRAGLFKNGVLNVLEGCDCEIEVHRSLSESEASSLVKKATGSHGNITNARLNKSVSKPIVADSSYKVKALPVISQEKQPAMTKNTCSSNAIYEGVSSKVSCISELCQESFHAKDYEFLKKTNNDELVSAGVDIKNKEKSLNDKEFTLIFGIDREAFYGFPKWKQSQMKKNVGLF